MSVQRVTTAGIYSSVRLVELLQSFKQTNLPVFSFIRTEHGEIQTRNNSVFAHFSRSAAYPKVVSVRYACPMVKM